MAHEVGHFYLSLELALRGKDVDLTVVIVYQDNVSIGVYCHTWGALQLPR